MKYKKKKRNVVKKWKRLFPVFDRANRAERETLVEVSPWMVQTIQKDSSDSMIPLFLITSNNIIWLLREINNLIDLLYDLLIESITDCMHEWMKECMT